MQHDAGSSSSRSIAPDASRNSLDKVVPMLASQKHSNDRRTLGVRARRRGRQGIDGGGRRRRSTARERHSCARRVSPGRGACCGLESSPLGGLFEQASRTRHGRRVRDLQRRGDHHPPSDGRPGSQPSHACSPTTRSRAFARAGSGRSAFVLRSRRAAATASPWHRRRGPGCSGSGEPDTR